MILNNHASLHTINIDVERKSVENVEVLRIKNSPMPINKRTKF